MDVTGDRSESAVRPLLDHFGASEPAGAFATELVFGVLGARERIDAAIADASEHWRLDRLSHVDLNVLRVATWELLGARDVPATVVIDEAIEIAKRFGSDDSPGFVNGVLDHIAATLGVKERRGALE
jgi:N utilization substance protein B